MKQIILFALVAIIFAQSTYKPLSCAAKPTGSTIVFTYTEDQAGNNIYAKYGTTPEVKSIGTCAIPDKKIMTCSAIAVPKGKYDLYIGTQVSDYEVATNKLSQQLLIVDGQGVFKIGKTSILPDVDEKIDFTLFFKVESGEEGKIGYKDGTTVNKLTCTAVTGKEETVNCAVKISKDGSYPITFNEVNSEIVLKVASSYLTVSLAIIFSLFLF